MIHIKDTIAAISTASGKGGIGIIRLSGENAIPIGLKIFKSKDLQNGIEEKKLYFGKVYDRNGNKVDHGYFVYFKAPFSFTGEDAVEISCHGSPQILKLVLEEAVAAGARLATPGEFTMRAFLNKRIDLIQAEALRDLIEARTSFQAKVAYSQLEGELSRNINPIKERLINLIAEAEASLDFPEEEEEFISADRLQSEIESIALNLEKLTSSYKEGKVIREGATVVIIGSPNVGKSSVFNQLLKYDRAIVTEMPGTTRDTIEEHVDLLGIPVRLVDTAGLRDGKDIIEREGVKRSKKSIERADIILYILDNSRPMTKEENDFFKECNPNITIILINKVDLEKVIDEAMIPSNFNKKVKISAKFGKNITKLNKLVRNTISQLGEKISFEAIVTNVRHGELLQKTVESMMKASRALEDHLSLEFALSDMKRAISFLGELTGEVTIEDIYDRIFSKFCLGK